MQGTVIDNNELVLLMPRQLSAIDFMQIIGEQSEFTPDQAANVQRQAEALVLPGKVTVWEAAETASALLAVNNMKHLRFQRSYVFPEVGALQYSLTVTLTDARPTFELTAAVIHQNLAHEIQHLSIPEKEARKIAHNILNSVRDMVRFEDERLARQAQYKPWTSVEELIAHMPRELTVGMFMELIQSRQRFSPAEVEDIIQQAKEIVGAK